MVGIRKTFDLTSLISAMATAALGTGLNAKLPHLTDAVEQEIEKVSEDFAENLVGDAIMGTPFNLETWIEDELASEIANKEATEGTNYLDKLRQQKATYNKANAAGKGLHQNSSTGLPKQKQDVYINNGQNFKRSATSNSNKAASKTDKPTPLSREEKKRYSLESYWDSYMQQNVWDIPTATDTLSPDVTSDGTAPSSRLSRWNQQNSNAQRWCSFHATSSQQNTLTQADLDLLNFVLPMPDKNGVIHYPDYMKYEQLSVPTYPHGEAIEPVYPFMDAWEMTTLRKGDMIYGGLPGQSAFFTDEAAVLNSFGDRNILYKNLQVRLNPERGAFRPNIGIYEVTKDTRIPTSVINANPELGAGSERQFFLGRGSSSKLELLNEIELREFYEQTMSTYRLSY